jgi:hypothetical protein
MRFYDRQHRFYAGVDLHTRTLHLCVLNQDGLAVFDKNLPAKPAPLLQALQPFRDGYSGPRKLDHLLSYSSGPGKGER